MVQDLEGKGEDEVVKRQDDLRKLVKGVVHCDATKDPPLAETGPYDIIVTSLCLIVASRTIEEYSQAVGRLTKLLKPGGKLIIITVQARNGADHLSYTAGAQAFPSLALTVESLTTVLKENGYIDINTSRIFIDDNPDAKSTWSPEVLALIIAVATKK